ARTSTTWKVGSYAPTNDSDHRRRNLSADGKKSQVLSILTLPTGRPMNYWLVKTEPDTYSWSDLVRDSQTVWDGVRNFQARSNMKKMQKGDIVFVYHTGAEKAIVGEAVVAQAAYPDPADEEWVAVDLKAGKALKNPV